MLFFQKGSDKLLFFGRSNGKEVSLLSLLVFRLISEVFGNKIWEISNMMLERKEDEMPKTKEDGKVIKGKKGKK